MNPTDTLTFKRAVLLAQSGVKSEAQALLLGLRSTNPTDLNLLLWLAFTAPSLDQAQASIDKAVELAPLDPNVVSAQHWLRQQIQTSSNAPNVESTSQFATSDFSAKSTYTVPTSDQYKQSSILKTLPFVIGFGLIIFSLLLLVVGLATNNTNSTASTTAASTAGNEDTAPRPFVSKQGSFHLIMPGVPVPHIYTNTDKEGYVYQWYDYNSFFDQDNIVYQAGYTDIDQRLAAQVVNDPRGYLNTLEITTKFRQEGTAHKVAIQLAGIEGVDVTYDGTPDRLRFYYYGTRVYSLYYANKGKQAPPYDVSTFLNSFKFGTGA